MPNQQGLKLDGFIVSDVACEKSLQFIAQPCRFLPQLSAIGFAFATVSAEAASTTYKFSDISKVLEVDRVRFDQLLPITRFACNMCEAFLLRTGNRGEVAAVTIRY